MKNKEERIENLLRVMDVTGIKYDEMYPEYISTFYDLLDVRGDDYFPQVVDTLVDTIDHWYDVDENGKMTEELKEGFKRFTKDFEKDRDKYILDKEDLSGRIFDAISDGYDDETLRGKTIIELDDYLNNPDKGNLYFAKEILDKLTDKIERVQYVTAKMAEAERTGEFNKRNNYEDAEESKEDKILEEFNKKKTLVLNKAKNLEDMADKKFEREKC